MQDGSCYCEHGDFEPALVRETEPEWDSYSGSEWDDHYADAEEDLARSYLELLG